MKGIENACLVCLFILGIALFSTLLMGQDCAAQSDPCTPDPCQSIQNAVPSTCMPIGGSCAPATDFTCDCETSFTWQDESNTCVELPPQCVDNDTDGYGSPGSAYCTYPLGDCDDTNADVHPGAPELCDGIDNQCPGDWGYGEVDEHCVTAQIPAGCFDMGDSIDGCYYCPSACPVHNVCISAFEMDVYEVTNAAYAECVAAGACTAPLFFDRSSRTRPSYYGNPAYDDFPVINVTWHKANDYCTWAGKRLPSEAEWEYAARGGLAGKRYPWGDTISPEDANWYYTGDWWDHDTSPVGSYAPNGYGLYDMAGNVNEFTNDWYSSTYYQYCVENDIVNDPPGPAGGEEVVLRGGSFWTATQSGLHVAFRYTSSPDSKDCGIGFRCARGGAYGP